MMQNKLLPRLIFILLLQFFIIRWLEFRDICHPFIYVYCLLLLPFKHSISKDMVFGGFWGIMVDMFYNSPGVHFFACVLIMFIRRYIVIDNLNEYERIDNCITSQTINKIIFRKYIAVLVIIHHTSIFLMDMGNFYHIGKFFIQLVFSCLFSILFILFYDYNISQRKTDTIR